MPLEATALAMNDLALAAGFPHVHAMRETTLKVYARSPEQIRTRSHAGIEDIDGDLIVLLPYRGPMQFGETLEYLRAHAIPAIESEAPSSYTRTLGAPGGPVRFTLTEAANGIRAQIRLTDVRDITTTMARIVRLLDLDADPARIDDELARDPGMARLVRRRPGLRSPGAVDGFEIAVRGIIGQQILVKAARTRLHNIVNEHGEHAFADEPLKLFPPAERFAAIAPESLAMPRARARTLIRVAEACAVGRLSLDPGADPAELRSRLMAIAGIGPWTADYIVMRALRDTDILLITDLGVVKSAEKHGVDLHAGRPDMSPWRSYMTNHLWAASHED